MGAGASANVLPESEIDIYASLMKKWDELFESNTNVFQSTFGVLLNNNQIDE